MRLNEDNILDAMKRATRPRLMIEKNGSFEGAYAKILSKGAIADYYNDLYLAAENYRRLPLLDYTIQNGKIPDSKYAEKRISALAAVYRIEKLKANPAADVFAKRALEEMIHACKGKWNSNQYFLDTAQIAQGVAIGYDWLYDYSGMNDEIFPGIKAREFIRDSLYEQMVIPAYQSYINNVKWTLQENNWNAVCNGSVVQTICAVSTDLDDEKKGICLKTLDEAVFRLEKTLALFDADGGWSEGLAYWEMATRDLVLAISTLKSFCGDDYNLSNPLRYAGFSKTCDFAYYMTSSKSGFNFSDSYDNFYISYLSSPQMLWFANRYQKRGYYVLHDMTYTKGNVSALNVLWYDSTEKKSSYTTLQKKLKTYFPKEEVIFKNTEIGAIHINNMASTSTFLAVKAGKNQLSHSDLDLGTFVYQSGGVRWAVDLSKDSYDLKGYFDTSAHLNESFPPLRPNRWDYYKKRAEGHNTLVINPSRLHDQSIDASGTITGLFEQTSKKSLLLNLTDAYKESAKTVNRQFDVDKKTGKVTITDTVDTLYSSDIYWFMHYKAFIPGMGVTGSPMLTPYIKGYVYPNKKRASLTYLGTPEKGVRYEPTVKKQLDIILESAEGEISIVDAVPLDPWMQSLPGQDNRDCFKKISIKITGSTGLKTLKVSLVPKT
ncbi:MAG: heparinase II/III-family protein [Clostridia bacterium]|nr:heparinase II/III-family protein [Clostridia bacterium]